MPFRVSIRLPPPRICLSEAGDSFSWGYRAGRRQRIDSRRGSTSAKRSGGASAAKWGQSRVPSHVVPTHPLPPPPGHIQPELLRRVSSLVSRVQDWLICIEDHQSPHWIWGLEVFWAAFVAACPLFPTGRWPSWNPEIPMGGAFIESHVNAFTPVGIVSSLRDEFGEETKRRREELWESLCDLVRLADQLPLRPVGARGPGF
ncbi:hypothetical protein BC834DRAFT_326761 [Gloeopeniophorella convolvens]|nr:hypothetical protein BC834DRAFT_326761 [Gloeopeniophorella convolvens]